MTILNISLCLPELDVVALSQPSGQGQSIVAVTERFIVPDKSFVLLPCRHLPNSIEAEFLYRPEVLSSLKQFALPSDDSVMAKYWAQCVFCQQIVDEEAITAISDRTIWAKSALLHHLKLRSKLFLSFLKVYKLLEAKSIDTEPVYDHLYKFLPLSEYLDVNHQNSVLSNDEFAAAKQAILEPAKSVSEGSNSQNSNEITPEPLVEEDAVNSSDWVSKISEVGNSSDGHTFEKLVRKGLIELGFSNTLDKPKISLDPEATGGAGGLDFYADRPYPIVGECKATKTKTVVDPATQLHKLGHKWLSVEEYGRSVSLIVAGGNITPDANKIAVGHKMNVIRPETLQSLVELKIKHEGSIDLSDLKAYLQISPFGTDADAKVEALIQRWETEFKQKEDYIQQRLQIIQTIKELSEQTIHRGKNAFVSVEIRAHYNAKYQPCVTDEATREMLKELASPVSGYLGRKQLPGDQERFYFVKDMPTLGA